ncbi:MAG: transglycosylase SLT domain-containing protein [Gammaproteobacteria bacterium]|nr:transglycosylase SLT domain-containing protein [Gammaproteobacteria bacterium]
MQYYYIKALIIRSRHAQLNFASPINQTVVHQNKSVYSKGSPRFLRSILSLLVFLILPVTSQADDGSILIEQRKDYLAAKKALRAGQLTKFKKTAETLKDYPLYPYLRYDYLKRRLWKVKKEEIIEFLKLYNDLPMANDLRKSWLNLLVKRRHWQTFIEHYTPQSDKTLQCHHLTARIKQQQEAYLLEDIRTIWLSGESLPPQCDAAFKLLYKSELLTDELVWQRIRLAMENGQTGLTTYLSRKLTSDKRIWAQRWLNMRANPTKRTSNVTFEDEPEAREILLYGIKRLTRQNINRALQRWPIIKPAYSFNDAELADVDYGLAIRAAQKKHKLAKTLLGNLSVDRVDEKAWNLRLRTILPEKDWATLVEWTEGQPAVEKIRLRWFYWRARALEELVRTDEAMPIYEWLAKERDYYGFLAADRINATYQMNYHPLPEDLDEWQNLSTLATFQRARELYYIGSHYSARREWHHGLKQLTSYQKQIAAQIAANWGWHDRAILTLAKAELYDDVITRFPMPFNAAMEKFSKMRKLDIAWLYALTRAESAFIEDVRSPAGALGLMQVMPATGKHTAKNIGLRNYNTKQLLQSDKNIRIGSAYLKQMYGSFNNNMVLATAAYNAGPTNVKRWLPKKDCEEAEIWIEQIPFTETRKYVRRILFFASVYNWRLQQHIVPVKQRVSMVQPHKQIKAGQSCPQN